MSAPTKIIGLRAAAKIASASPETVRAWCDKYKIGELVDGRYRIDRTALAGLLKRRAMALERGPYAPR